MGRSTWTGRTVVYRYGCPARADLDPAALEQLQLGHQLGNDLVALWHRHEQAVAEAWASRQAVAAAEQAVAAAEQAVTDAEQTVAADRQQRRSRTATSAATARVREARAALRDARAEAKRQKEGAREALAPTFQELTEQWWAARKATYADYCQRRGLFWMTHNDVEQNHLRAVAAVKAARAAGRPAELRVREGPDGVDRWDGSGSIVVQLKRRAGDPPRTPGTLAGGKSQWRNVVELPWIDPVEWVALSRAEQRHRRLQPLKIRIGMDDDRQPVWCEVPVLWHRPIPADADITGVRVSRRHLAGRHRLSVEVTCRLPVPAPTTRTATAGLDIGWRSMEDGSIRVAVWRSRIATLVAVTAPLQGAVTTYLTGGEVRIPARWIDQWRQVQSLASIRAKNLQLLRADLVAMLKANRRAAARLRVSPAELDLVAMLEANPQAAARLGVSPPELGRWRSPAWFAQLAVDQREAGVVGRRLEAWRVQDRHLWTWQANLRDQLIARRRDLYRNVAAALTAAYGTVMVERPFVADVTRRPVREQTDSRQAQRARWQVRLAAPASLLAAVKQAAAARGVTVQELDAAQTTLTHHGCGGTGDPAQAGRQVLVACPTCGTEFDQDVNAAWWLADGGVPTTRRRPPSGS
jgi:Putative transposase DNA-binding domain